MKLKAYFFLFVFILVMAPSVWAVPATTIQSTQKFITLADIHFDPFAVCESLPRPCPPLQKMRAANIKDWDSILATNIVDVARYGEDTNYRLLQATVAELKKINQSQQPQFALILGDFLAHSFREKYIKYSKDKSKEGYSQFVKKTLEFLTYKFNQAFPNVSVYPAVGNNDSYTGNYNVVAKGAFLRDTAVTWSAFIKESGNRQQFLREFPENGAYVVNLPNKQKLIILNTVLFTSKGHDKSMAVAAQKQLQWLQEELSRAQREHAHVILAFHIPMGVDVFTSLKLLLFSVREFWRVEYSTEFEKILQQFPTTIAAILPAHIHMDAYQIIPELNIPVIFTPSISPNYGNNPGFKVLTYYPATLQIENYVTYFYPYADATDWQQEYSFNQIYQPDCKTCEVIHGMQKLSQNNPLADDYQKFYSVSNLSHAMGNSRDWRPYYWCGINNINKLGYKLCLRSA